MGHPRAQADQSLGMGRTDDRTHGAVPALAKVRPAPFRDAVRDDLMREAVARDEVLEVAR